VVKWGRTDIPVLGCVPVFGAATAQTWAGRAEGTQKYPGTNHPRLGRWIYDMFGNGAKIVLDPMIGVGGLQYLLPPHVKVIGTDVNKAAVGLSYANLGRLGRVCRLSCEDAATAAWREGPFWLAMTSPEFPQSHSAGATQHQQDMMEKKRLYAFQDFARHRYSTSSFKGQAREDFICRIYENVERHLFKGGYFAVVLKNRIKHGEEVDEVGLNLRQLRRAGFRIQGGYVRPLLRPTGYQAWKFAKNPNMPWVKGEWVVVCRK